MITCPGDFLIILLLKGHLKYSCSSKEAMSVSNNGGKVFEYSGHVVEELYSTTLMGENILARWGHSFNADNLKEATKKIAGSNE